MTKSTQHTTTDKWKKHVRDLGDGVKLEAEIAPCVFMYPAYPLQITVTLHRHPGEYLGQAHACDRTKTADTYTDASVERLLASVRISPCPRCSAPAFDPATIETNRGGLCEACFLGDLKAEWAEEEEAEQRKIADRDRRMKRKGMAVRVTAWIHSADGGDDYQVDWYFRACPTPRRLRTLLLKERSAITDDYCIITL
jgi:hypothetical protein